VRWSPTGDWIAYIDTGLAVRLIHPDGTSELNSLVTTALTLDWSPDGSRFISIDNNGDPDPGFEVIQVDPIEPSFPHEQTTHSHGREWDPAWSPDGSSIVYVNLMRLRNGNNAEDLWVMNADGTHRRPLVRGFAFKSAPVWQPTPG
jgi:Tol biopolymer transport system component